LTCYWLDGRGSDFPTTTFTQSADYSYPGDKMAVG